MVPHGVAHHAATLLGRTMVVLGGVGDAAREAYATLVCMPTLDIATSTWGVLRANGTAPSSRMHHTAVSRDDSIFLCGGQELDGSPADGALYVFDVGGLMWRKVDAMGPSLDSGLCITGTNLLLRNGRALFSWCQERGWVQTAEITSPATPLGLTELSDGSCLVATATALWFFSSEGAVLARADLTGEPPSSEAMFSFLRAVRNDGDIVLIALSCSREIYSISLTTLVWKKHVWQDNCGVEPSRHSTLAAQERPPLPQAVPSPPPSQTFSTQQPSLVVPTLAQKLRAHTLEIAKRTLQLSSDPAVQSPREIHREASVPLSPTPLWPQPPGVLSRDRYTSPRRLSTFMHI